MSAFAPQPPGPAENEFEDAESRAFLDGLYRRTAAGEVPAAMDSVVEFVDELLNAGRFAACDRLLRMVDSTRLPSSLRRAFLMVTYPAKAELPSRAAFWAAAKWLLSREHGAEKANKMLKSLA